MAWFKNLKIGSKLMIGYVFAAVLIIGVGWFAIVRTEQVNNILSDVANHLLADERVMDNLNEKLLESRVHAMRYIVVGDEAGLNEYRNTFAQLLDNMDEADAEVSHWLGDSTALIDMRTQIEKYGVAFNQIVALKTERARLESDVLNTQWAVLAQSLETLQNSVLASGATVSTLAVLNAERYAFSFSILTARYVSTGDSKWADQAYIQHDGLVKALDKLDTLLSDKDQKDALAIAIAASNAYRLGLQNYQENLQLQDLRRDDQNNAGDEASRLAESVIDVMFGKIRANQTQAENMIARTIQILIMLTLVAAFGGIFVGVYTSRNMVRALDVLKVAAKQLEQGNLEIDLTTVDYADEVGDLARAIGGVVLSQKILTMTASQVAQGDLSVDFEPRSTVDSLGIAVASMITSLRVQVSQVFEGVSILTASANQLMTTSTELASTASQTASAISETSATIAEVRQTAEVSVKNMEDIAQKTQSNAEISQQGLSATELTTSEMVKINEQIEFIADSVVQLSEQGQSIANIIGAVQDLAEQSNLLAVNAAIEAAKAGEQGKGFSVVAQEIKNLAEQSKQFTVQVQNILNDIQKATGKAVMTTEKGQKAVTKGMEKSEDAGGAIRQLTDLIMNSAQLAAQTNMSSQEQLLGVEQVVEAMESIKTASLQNVDGARQLEDAARSLEELAQRMQVISKQFTL